MGRHTLYWRWIAANGLAEAAGLGTTFVLAWRLAPFLEGRTEPALVLGSAVLAVIVGTLLEGLVVGRAQEVVLRQHLQVLRAWSWTLATAAGAALAWVLGMVPSTIMSLQYSESAAPPPAEPGAALQLGLAAALGLVAGPILGLAQWSVLRRFVAHAGWWLWANALAWAVGMPLIFAGMDVVPWSGHPAAIVLSIYAVAGGTGLVVGAIHGRILMKLLTDARWILETKSDRASLGRANA